MFLDNVKKQSSFWVKERGIIVSNNNIVLINSENFGSIKCDFWRNDQDQIFMTSEQLGQALGYSQPRKSISNLVTRNTYLSDEDFSGVIKMMTPSGVQETRIFTEDGIYEVTFLASTPKAKEFRSWVRKILKGLRTGKLEIKPKAAELNAEAKLIRARTYAAKTIFQTAKDLQGVLPREDLVKLAEAGRVLITGEKSNKIKMMAPDDSFTFFWQGVMQVVDTLVAVEKLRGEPLTREMIREDVGEFKVFWQCHPLGERMIDFAVDHYETLKRQLM